jgi:hypothetical protein
MYVCICMYMCVYIYMYMREAIIQLDAEVLKCFMVYSVYLLLVAPKYKY